MHITAYEDWNQIQVAVENPEGEYEGITYFLFSRAQALRYGLRLILAAFGICRKDRVHKD